MTWAEFQIRLFAWKRTEDRAWEKVRFVAWHAMTGSHLNAKKLPKTLNQFLPLSFDKKQTGTLTEAHKEAFLNAMKDYLKQKA